MEYSRLPIQYMQKPITEFINDQEEYFATQHGKVTVHKASAEDIAKIEAEMASRAKREAITVNIRGELNLAPKHEKKPEVPFEEIPRKPQRLGNQYNPVKFDGKVAG